MNIVLFEPEIPLNTGNIGRTCVVTGSSLHLIEPLGFLIDDKQIKRSGMDYWYDLDVVCYKNYGDFIEKNPHAVIYMASTKGNVSYTDVSYRPGDYIMFGKESGGIPEEILRSGRGTPIRIPMRPGSRSLNLSNSAAVVLYEALRQTGFASLELTSDFLE